MFLFPYFGAANIRIFFGTGKILKYLCIRCWIETIGRIGRQGVSRKSLIWKIPCLLAVAVLGTALLLLTAATVVLVTPGARTAVLRTCVAEINRRTDLDVDLERLYLSPFHQSPARLFRAFQGKSDLPLHIEIDSLYIGHRGMDTLVYVHRLRLLGRLQKGEDKNLTDRTIEVERLRLDRTTFHSGPLISAVGVNVILKQLQARSPGLNIAQGKYPLQGLRLADVYVGIDLRDNPPDTTADTVAKKTVPMAFDIPDAELSNVHFVLNPLGLHILAGSLATDVLVDVGGNCYHARRLDIGGASLTLRSLYLPFDAIRGDARVDLNTGLIESKRLYARSETFGAKADLENSTLNLETMRVDVTGKADYRGSQADLSGYYDIDEESYDVQMTVGQVDASSFLKGGQPLKVTGRLHAQGTGINPRSPAMESQLSMHLTDCVYGPLDGSGLALDASLSRQSVNGTLFLPVAIQDSSLRLKASTHHRLRVSDFMAPERMGVDYHSQMENVDAHLAGEDFDIDRLQLDFATDSATSLNLTTAGLAVKAESPMHVLRLVEKVQPLLHFAADSTTLKSLTSLRDLTLLDTLKHLLPELRADIRLTKGSPVQPLIERMGLDIRAVALSFRSDARRSDLALDASIPGVVSPDDSAALRLPAASAALRLSLTEGRTDASLTARADIADGVMSVQNLSTNASLDFKLERDGSELNGAGQIVLDQLEYGGVNLGNRTADIRVTPSRTYEHAVRTDVRLNDIPLELVKSIIQIDDIDLGGFVRAKASADGLPAKMDISAEVLPLDVSATYKPYDIKLALGETPITMNHNQVDFRDFRIYGIDSTYLALNGGLDISKMRLDVDLAADHFAPVRLERDGPLPVYGNLETDIRGRVSGPTDNILADVDVTLLPTTDITYPIDEKNLAQVKPHGTVNVQYGTADGALQLDGIIHVDEGEVRYSPKMYPMMPFQVDSASNITFHGPLNKTKLNISASQEVKTDVQSEGEETRRVVFDTGVRIGGSLDSLGLKSIGFFLEAPDDETITRELTSMDKDTREGIAATLLATGMYMGESNVAAQKDGYALSSILKSRLNAAMANSKMGKVIDIDISSGQKVHASGKTNDMNIAISKSLFGDKLRLTAGSTISDSPEVNKANGLLSHISASYKLTRSGDVFLRLFSQRDYDNIFEGELYKSGIGVGASKKWKRERFLASRGDTITRTYNFTADADITYRSNNSIGPNLTLSQSIRNLLGRDETFAIKGHGAYYWALRDRHPGDPKRNDTYKFGLDASLTFPYLHWAGDNIPDGDTRYRLGYKYENIAGGCNVHKFTGAFSYIIRPSRYVTHVFTPFSLSLVRTRLESDGLDKTTNFPELIRMLAGNEFVPSVGYGITYSDYRSKRPVNTMVDVEVKESGNLLNAAYCAFGRKWNEREKSLFGLPFNQFVKLTAEFCNRFNLTEQVCIATRLFAGANVPLGNSDSAPLSEAFYAGGPNSLRAAEPYAIGSGNFHSFNYNQNFFHAGDIKLEANFELRFPLFWKIFGAAFVDAGNVWNWYSLSEILSPADYAYYIEKMGIKEELQDGIVNNPDIAKQIALGTGAGLRLDLDGLVIRLDLGVGIHAPYQTYKYTKEGKPDFSQPITTYYNIPSVFDGLRVNFGIGYPF